MAYLPLYFAGPTCTYNAFVSHIDNGASGSSAGETTAAATSLSTGELAKYAVRWVIALVLLETMQHFIPAVALQHEAEWLKLGSDSPLLIFTVCYFTLVGIWLKFVVIWRFFRLWALCDGVEPPENMKRCFFNNYSFQGFWRAWHHSFNCWLLRYLYFPVGGGKGTVLLPAGLGKRTTFLPQLVNIFAVFSFVVFAHAPWVMRDLKILAWGWACAAFFAPEIIGQALVRNPSTAARLRSMGVHGHVCALAGGVNIGIMMIINLVSSLDNVSRLSRGTVLVTVVWQQPSYCM
jgi:D-alanyl-lipoteichoic acid acyltransferase DltB (MBOAT superfamily)